MHIRENRRWYAMENGNLWNSMEALRREIERTFSQGGFRPRPFQTAFLPGQAARRYPLINLHENQDTLYVEALAPGVEPASLELSVVGHTLTISGEKRRLPEDIKPEAFHRSEREAGRFRRSIELPVEVDANHVKADYRNGLLLVTLPKSERAKPKQISVQVA
jgi:HSP20 family protein